MNTEFPPQSVDVGHGIKAAEYLEQRHLSKELAKQNGWYLSTQAGDCFPRIVIPAVTHKVGHVYWQARDITGKAFIRYQSPKGPRHEALIKVSPKQGNPLGIVIVEGPMDALAAAGAGYLSYSIMGMQPSTATLMHLALLIQDTPHLNILVVLDRDSAQHALKISLFLSSQGYASQIAQLTDAKDLAECLPTQRRKFLSQSFLNLFRSKNSAKDLRVEKPV